MTCRDCKWWNAETNVKGKRMVTRAAKCLAPETPLPQFPASVLVAYGFRWPLSRNNMWSGDGADCPVFEPVSEREPVKVGG